MWQIAVAFLVGMGVAEYYNRGRIDQIRKEQLEELRTERSRMRERERYIPRREPVGLVSDEQYAQYRSTGRTGGKRINN